MKKNRVVSLFDHSGVMVEPWLEAGYDCWCIDIQNRNEDEDLMHTRGWDLSVPGWHGSLPFNLDEIAFVAAFPPCDHLAISGARWFKGKGLGMLAEAIKLVWVAAEFCNKVEAPWMIENPISTLSTYWREPDYKFHPHYFTRLNPYDNYQKLTCLWTGNGFIMPDKAVNPVLGEPDTWVDSKGQGKNRAKERAITPLGFARAVFEVNHGN